MYAFYFLIWVVFFFGAMDYTDIVKQAEVYTMKKFLTIILTLLVITAFTALFTSCDEENRNNDDDDDSSTTSTTPAPCEHTGGTATCTQKAICTECNEEYGDLGPHEMVSATCTEPASCKNCTYTEGEAAGHAFPENWSFNPSEHFRTCTLHPDITESEAHADENLDGNCDTCEYVVKNPTNFTVTVVDDSGRPVQGAEVKLFTESEEVTLITNENGALAYEFMYYEYVKASIVSFPVGYRYTSDAVVEFEGTNMKLILQEVVFFDVYILDLNENGIEGATVSFSSTGETVQTDQNGFARFAALKSEIGNERQNIIISSLPTGYILTDSSLNFSIEIEHNGTFTAHAGIASQHTVSAKNESGAPLKNAVFKFMNNGMEIAIATTDESGTATVSLPQGEYTIEISHLSAFYSTEASAVNWNTESGSYEAVFKESSESQLVWATVVYDDGSLADNFNTQVYIFKEDNTYDVNLLGINSNSQAATFMKNEDCIFFAIDKDMNYAIARFNKDDPTEMNMVMTKGNAAGSAEHPLPIILLADLPYNVENVYLNFNREFAAGESLYLKVFNALAKTVTINGNLFTLEYNGDEIAPNEDGIISHTFADLEFGADAIIKITAKEDATEDIKVEYEGSYDNPILVYSNNPEDIVQEVTLLGAGQVKYYSFANMKDAPFKLSVTVQGANITVIYPDGDIVGTYGWLTIKVIANEVGNATITFNAEEIVEDATM